MATTTTAASVKRHAVTLVIAALAVVATAYVLVVDRGTASDAERATRAHHVFTAFRADEITRIDLERPNDHLILERDARASDAGSREWRLVDAHGGASPADQAAAAALVTALDSASTLRGASDDPAEFVPIRATGTIAMGRIAAKLTLGKEASSPAGAAYLRVDSEAPIVVSAELAQELLQPADRFRAKDIVPNVAERLDTLAIDHGEHHVAWTRTGPSIYRLANGRRASRAALDRVELGLVDLRAESFLPANEATQLLANTAGDASGVTTVTLRAEGGEPLTLRFGGACPGHLDNAILVREANAQLPALGACVAKAALAVFAVEDADLVERHVFQARADEVSELRLASPGATLDLARKGDGWHERAPQDRDLTAGENEAAAALLDRMVALEGEPHLPTKDAGAPRDHTATLRYGEPAVDDAFAFDGSGVADEMTIDARAVALLTPSAATLRPLAFWTPPLDRLHVDAVTLRCDGREEKATNSPEGWSLGALPADGPAVLDVVDAVAGERAARWLSPDETSTKAPAAAGASCRGPYAIELHLAAHGGQGEGTACVSSGQMGKDANGETIVRIERRVGGGLGGAAGSTAEMIAAVTSDFRAQACAHLVDRHGFVLPDDAATVTLRAPGHPERRLVVDALRNAAPDEDASDAATAKGVAAIAALDGLVADDVAHLGAPAPGDALGTPALVVTIARADGGAPRTLRFGGEIAGDGGASRKATVDGLAAVFTFASAKLAPLFDAADVVQKAP